MNNKQNIGNSNKVIIEAQKLMLEFLMDNFDSEKIDAAMKVISNCPVYFVEDNKITERDVSNNQIYDSKKVSAFANNDGIFLSLKYKNYYMDSEFEHDDVLKTIIHEYAHRLRAINSTYGNMFEEGFATIFAEACIINSKIKVASSNGMEVEQPGVFNVDGYKYVKAESQIRAILYFLNQKGLDIQLIGEYIFGNQEYFKQKCIDIFGEKFKDYFEIANSSSDQYYNDYDDEKRNSYIQLIDILSNYIKNNEVNLGNYWNNKQLLLYNRGSDVLASSVVLAGKDSLREEDKVIYNLFEYKAKIANQDKENEITDRIDRIKKIVSEKYSLVDKKMEEVYSIILDLCSEYIQRRDSDKKENRIFIDEIKKIIPNIDEFTKQFIELRKNGIDFSKLKIEDNKNITYQDISSIVATKLEEIKFNRLSEEIKTKFNGCSTKKELLAIIDEFRKYENIVDLNAILPNYSEFVKSVDELKDKLPEIFNPTKEWNYDSLYNELLNFYIIEKEQDLIQAKEQVEDYNIHYKNVNTQYKVLANESSFIDIKAKNDSLNDNLVVEQETLEQETKKRIDNKSKKDDLVEKRDKLQKKNILIRMFKRKEIGRLSEKIKELNENIQINDTNLEKARSSISNLREQLKENEQQLLELCGLGIEDYSSILVQCKLQNFTLEQLKEKMFDIEKKIDSLSIYKQEQELSKIYEKNGIGRQPDTQLLEENQGFSR